MSDQLALLESPPESLEDPFVAGEEQGITEMLMDDVLETMQTVVEDAERARKDRAATMRMAACVVWEAASKTARYKDKLLHGPMGIPQMERDEAIVASALDNFRHRARDDGKGGRDAGEAARHMTLDEIAKKFIAETPANLIDDLSSTVREALSAVEPDSLGEELGPAAMVIVALAAALPLPVASAPQQHEGVAERPPGASASAFPTGSTEAAKTEAAAEAAAEAEAAKAEASEAEAAKQAEAEAGAAVRAAKEKQQQRLPKGLAFGDSVTAQVMGREQKAGKDETHALVTDDLGASKVGAQPKEVYDQMQDWVEAKGGFKGAKLFVSPGAANNPADVGDVLPEMIRLAADSGASGLLVSGVPRTPPTEGVYRDAGAEMIKHKTAAEIEKIVEQAKEKYPDLDIQTIDYEAGVDRLHPSDSALAEIRDTEVLKEIEEQRVEDFLAAVELAEAEQHARDVEIFVKAAADAKQQEAVAAENQKIWDEAAADAKKQEAVNAENRKVWDAAVAKNEASLSPEQAFERDLKGHLEHANETNDMQGLIDFVKISPVFNPVTPDVPEVGGEGNPIRRMPSSQELQGAVRYNFSSNTPLKERMGQASLIATTLVLADQYQRLVTEDPRFPGLENSCVRIGDLSADEGHGSHDGNEGDFTTQMDCFVRTDPGDGPAFIYALGDDGYLDADRDKPSTNPNYNPQLSRVLIEKIAGLTSADGPVVISKIFNDPSLVGDGTTTHLEHHASHWHLGTGPVITSDQGRDLKEYANGGGLPSDAEDAPSALEPPELQPPEAATAVLASSQEAPQSETNEAHTLPDYDAIDASVAEQRDALPSAREGRSDEDDIRRHEVTAKVTEQINPTPEAYLEFVAGINKEYSDAFSGGDIITPDDREHFVIHHTAYGYPEGEEGIKAFIGGMQSSGLSIPWAIDREGKVYQLTEDPWQSTAHVKDFNSVSSGVENFTSDQEGQETVKAIQIHASINLATFMVLRDRDIRTMSDAEIDEAVAMVDGHRKLNDDSGRGTAGKPDFNETSTQPIRDKVRDLLHQLRDLSTQESGEQSSTTEATAEAPAPVTEAPEVNQPEAPTTTGATTTTTGASAPPDTAEVPTSTPEVIDELANYRPLFDLIARGESGGNYNAYFGNTTNSDEHFTSMTIQQVINWQADYVAGGSPSSAVGKYQMMQETLNEMVDKHGVDPNALYDEAMQDRLAIKLLEKRDLSKYLSGELSPEQFAAELAKEWAALPKVLGDNPGDSYYQGDGLNKSSIGVGEFLNAVNQIK